MFRQLKKYLLFPILTFLMIGFATQVNAQSIPEIHVQKQKRPAFMI